MKIFFNYLLICFKYLLFQAIAEIVLIIIFEYLGVKVLSYFSLNNLFVENVQGVVWEIFMKTVIFSFVYVPLFIVICALLGWRQKKSNFFYSVINAVISFVLTLIFLLVLRKADFSEVLNLLIATVLSSLIIVIITFNIKALNSKV